MSLITKALDKLDVQKNAEEMGMDAEDDITLDAVGAMETSRRRLWPLALIPAALLLAGLILLAPRAFHAKNKPSGIVAAQVPIFDVGEDDVENITPPVEPDPLENNAVVEEEGQSTDNNEEEAIPEENKVEAASPSVEAVEPESPTPDVEIPAVEETMPDESESVDVPEVEPPHSGVIESPQPSPDNAKALQEKFNATFNRAVMHQNNRDYYNAVKAYRECLLYNPDAATAYANMGIIHARLGDYETAISHMKKALSIQPENQAARNNLGVLLLEHGQNEDALREFKLALSQNPGCAETYVNAGLACMRLDRRGAAIEAFETALRLDPDLPDAHYNYGLLLDRQGDYEKAVQHYSEYLNGANGNNDAILQQVRQRIEYLKGESEHTE